LLVAAIGRRGNPQRGQKAKSGSQAKPQLVQGAACRRPHRGQSAVSAKIPKPQPTQVIDRLMKPCRAAVTIAQQSVSGFADQRLVLSVGQQTRAEFWRGLWRGLFPMTALLVIVLGSIFAGWATPTESGAVGVLGSMLIAALNRQ
jgi:TRAP-type mannitol/chloroaromatic compound transport system permease large subunit